MKTLVCFFAALGLVACKGEDEAPTRKTNGPLEEPETLEFRNCQTDDDCTFATNGCCDCANGGEEIAVATADLEAFRDSFDCTETSCTERARVPPCGCGVVSCVDGVCDYALDGPDCSATTISCGADLGLGPEDAVEIDSNGFERVWVPSEAAGHFTLTWEGGCGDECSETRVIEFGDENEPCPSFLSAHVTTSECGAGADCVETTQWALDGALELQDWQIAAGPVAGRLTGALSLTFYWSL